MTKYNVNFELTVEDMDLIEEALRQSKRDLSQQALSAQRQEMQNEEATGDLDESMRQIQELLGRLHNQKVFYRPRAGSYIGG